MNLPSKTVLLACVVLLAACLEDEPATNEAMLIKAAQLTKLATALESTVRYKNPPADLDEQGLLQLATQHDPQLLANFAGLKVRALAKARHSTVLVCTADGQRRLMEDAACTVELDKHHWKESAQPCEFTVDTAVACPAP
ncbi:MAG: hypothetical protein HZB47_14420 [Nitrosomonadales bacterium]|nr:hypothetical protein [Nitrosomonadales bacterium]